jgi:predicted HicB family RNase H-like nuclease
VSAPIIPLKPKKEPTEMTTLRMPAEFKRRLHEAAKARGLSLSKLCLYLLQYALEELEKGPPPPSPGL